MDRYGRQGLFHFNPVTRSVEPFKDPLIYQNIHGLCLDDDALWVGTFSQGLNKIDLRTRKVKHMPISRKTFFLFSGQLPDIISGNAFRFDKL